VFSDKDLKKKEVEAAEKLKKLMATEEWLENKILDDSGELFRSGLKRNAFVQRIREMNVGIAHTRITRVTQKFFTDELWTIGDRDSVKSGSKSQRKITQRRNNRSAATTKKKKTKMTKFVTIVGNGESRRGFDIIPIKQFSTVIGCNAQFRDYNFETFVCCDRHMCQEAANTVGKNTIIHTRKDWAKQFANVA